MRSEILWDYSHESYRWSYQEPIGDGVCGLVRENE